MSQPPRLLPWKGSGGKPCYLITDDRDGPLSRLADATESVQLGMGSQLLAHAREILPDTPPGELRFLAECLTQALDDALRVAESRGRRLEQMGGAVIGGFGPPF
ncbi:hypothetical protein [Streptomyces sp. NPDC001410]|uniref:hypothetical protein n=1 Tax=Streptomyces sp. NPDC001410 TaxID=3364574 RepID=UPI0036C643D9